jgi:L-seryl-tRNA(Ser) seleniumtransferase
MKIIDKPRSLPSIHQILRDINLTPLIREYGILIVTQCVQTVLSKIRKKIIQKNTITYNELVKQVKNEILGAMESSLKPVINLTGTVLHTNLGRAQLPETAIQAMVDVARGASSLEYDLENGRRGDRHRHSEELICRLTGAQAAAVVTIDTRRS